MSLEAQTFREFETIVVDNGSTDDSLAYLLSDWPHVRVIQLSQNLGFGAAVNAGIEATASDYVALVNNDVRTRA